ncbi:U2 SMALL NUCLEAR RIBONUCLEOPROTEIN AUXILIARY FACTOR-LIKE PROTEIN [Salix koriyanagi]|uniref:U2 SMALL NUCLEAR RIBONUCLEOPROTEIN AUXILIARY FACTOR-LIKE PROTEIN n=1 Tax=Salix koriyanagi TaxID=2511006 RepID=A0A9Q0P769_9ROSI|nr:U2 SMALL NUCLEAR RIBONUCLEOPROTEIN AUXILIARY FACTOR-LIKE PROTEIN [Salix koriyanagi]
MYLLLMAITLKFRVTDYHSNTFEAIKSAMQLDDMRDCIGIGGSWNEFVEYLVASLKAEDVKLVLEKLSNSDDVAYAKLVAQKSKGMPLISISLTKLLDNAARDCMANMSFGLFKAFKYMKNMVVQEKEHSLQLTKIISAEKERSENIQRQLGKRQKLEKMNSSDKLDVSGPPASNGAQNSPDKLAGRDPASTKATNRVVEQGKSEGCLTSGYRR